VPGTSALEYFAFAKLLLGAQEKTVCQAISCAGPLYEKLARPLWLAALNTDPKEASARLAAAVTRETLARGGTYCRPLIAHGGLSQAFVDPALEFLRRRKVRIALGSRLRKIEFAHDRVTALDFGEEKISIGPHDIVILAVPPLVARDLLPHLVVPSEFRAIVNAHFRIGAPQECPPMLGVLNGTIEWLFAFPQRLSVTISAAERLVDVPREQLANDIWREVAMVTRLSQKMPAWQIVRERRATFAATPQQESRRPDARTGWSNLFLAGDWTRTGLPATIEGAIRSGNVAADLARSVMGSA
jgi:squalene-associated FAD-dependent desaturase